MPATVNGTHRFLERYIYNGAVYVQFDSAVGALVAATELGGIAARAGTSSGARGAEEERVRRRAHVCRRDHRLRRSGGAGGKEKTLDVVGLASREGEKSPASEPQRVPGWMA